MFSVRAKSGRAAGFVSAYAEQVSGGERVFYLSKEDGSAELAAAAKGGARSSERAVRIGSGQLAGTPLTGVAAWAHVEVAIVE